MNEFIKSFIDFIYANYKFIIAVILSVLGLLIFINVKEINLNLPKPSTKLVQSVTVETFTSSSNNNNIDQNIDQGLSKYGEQPVLGSLYQSNQNIPETNADDIEFMPIDGISNFCTKYSQSPKDQQTACNGLSHATCQNIACCALIGIEGSNETGGNSTCVAADKNGPIFKKDINGQLISMDHYYYEGNKYNIKQ